METMGPQDQRHPDAAQRHFVRADAVFLAVAVLGSAALQFSFPQLIGSDGFFHLRMAERVLTGEMPWMPGSIFDEGWVDHQLLFHLLLAPFAWLLPGVPGAKAAAATFAAIAAFACYRLMLAERSPAPLLYALLPAALLNFMISDIGQNYLAELCLGRFPPFLGVA